MSPEPKPGNPPIDQSSPLDRKLLLATVALGAMLAPLNSTMIAVAMPEIMVEFGVGLEQTGWLVTGYLIAMAALQPVAGKIGDRVGRRPLILGGMAAFGLASIAAAGAPNLWLLLAWRVMQAVAGAVIVPNGAALMRETTPETQRASSFGLVGAAVALAAASGPLLGGVLVETAGWHAIFYVNAALILPAIIIGWQWLPHTGGGLARGRFDLAGAVALAALLASAAALLMVVARDSNLLKLAVGGTLIAMGTIAFGWFELRHADPVLSPRFFRRRAFAAANFSIGLSNLAMYSLLLAVPLLLATRAEVSSVQTGGILAAMSVAMVAVSPFGGRMADKFGRRLPVVVGLTLQTVGALPTAILGVGIWPPALIIGLALVGVGVGLSAAGLQTTAVESVQRHEAGVASGVYSTSRYMGSIIGSALLAGLLSGGNNSLAGLGLMFAIILGASFLAMISGLGLRARPASS